MSGLCETDFTAQEQHGMIVLLSRAVIGCQDKCQDYTVSIRITHPGIITIMAVLVHHIVQSQCRTWRSHLKSRTEVDLPHPMCKRPWVSWAELLNFAPNQSIG